MWTSATKSARRRAENSRLVTWKPKGCGVQSSENEMALHRAYFAAFRDVHLRIFRLKLEGKRAEAAAMAAEYNGRSNGVVPCLCGCGQKPLF